MKKLSKVTTLTVVTILAITLFAGNARALEDPDAKVLNPGTVGEVFKFSSIDDGGMDKTGGNVSVAPMVGGNTLIYSEFYGPANAFEEYGFSTGWSTISKSFIEYLSSSWALSSGYTWSKTKTATWTYSLGVDIGLHEKVALNLGLSKSRSTSYSVAVQIPADPSRFSKLGFASDFRKQNWQIKTYYNGSLYSTKEGSFESPTVNSYLLVYYQ